MIDATDNTVTVCMDYIKSRCSREKCKYFHPPAHLQAKIKSSQQQVNQTAVAAQAAAVVRQSFKFLTAVKCFTLHTTRYPASNALVSGVSVFAMTSLNVEHYIQCLYTIICNGIFNAAA